MVGPGENYQINLNEFDQARCSNQSRRVLITGLPGSATAAQVASGVAGLGGVLNIFVNHDLRQNTVPGQLAAVVEFLLPASARAYVNCVSAHGIWFVDLEGLHHQILAHHILTPSHAVTHIHPRAYGFLDNGLSGRCIELLHFPVGAIWWLLKEFGIRHIVEVTFYQSTQGSGGVLTVGFANIFESTRFCNHLVRGYFPAYRPTRLMVSFARSPCDRSIWAFEYDGNMLVDHIEPDHIEQTWNVSPYNEFTRPAQNFPYGEPIPRRPVARHAAPSPGTTEDTSQVNIREDDGTHVHGIPASVIKARMSTEEAEYILIGDRIFARTQEDSDAYHIQLDKDELSGLKELYVLDESWKPFWDQFSLTLGINIRSYYAYAQVAAARRETNQRLGRPDWHSGDMLEQTAVPNSIYSYSHPHVVRQVVNTTD